MSSTTQASHAAREFPGLRLDAYSLDLPSPEGQLGDRASNRAFDALLQAARERLRQAGGRDPFG
ncbi:MAG TPA: hypothetical protein VE033_15110, partial [Acetobacteraceae bacterium]|nr:hypothetical protein [Acetobacteraceae bacterium]